MGYYMNQVDSSFRMKKENIPGAWEKLKEMFIPGSDGSEYHYSWIVSEVVRAASTFEDALSEARFDVSFAPNGDIVGILFNGEKYGDEDLVLESIAPFVENDSFIIMQGEDGARWKWKFVDGKLIEVNGRFVFDDEV